MSENKRFQQLLNTAYLEWQLERGVPSTKREYAKYVGINYTMMSHYFGGRRTPSGDNLTKLTLAIGPRVLTSLDLIKDPMLKFVLNNFHELSPDQIENLMKEARVTADERELSGLPAREKGKSKT